MSQKKPLIQKWLQDQSTGIIAYAILRDAFVYLTLGLAALFTFETILPGFISLRFNLAIPILIEALLLLAILHTVTRYRLALPASPKLDRFILILGSLWLVIILFISLLKYSLLAKVIIIALTLAILRLVWQEYIAQK